VNYATTNVFKQLEDKQKAARNTRSCDYRHLMLLLPFSLSTLFREEVEEHNSAHPGAAVVDPSEELIGVTNALVQAVSPDYPRENGSRHHPSAISLSLS